MSTVTVSVSGEIGNVSPEVVIEVVSTIAVIVPEAWDVSAEIQHPKPPRPIPRVVAEILAH